ncbi:MAG: hypothetical protein ACRD8O_15210 [Bryobacteraceae bacterium]
MRRILIAGAVWLAVGAAALLAQAKQPQPKSQKEVEALQAMFATQDPDARIKAADELIKKFADTEFKTVALYLMAASYEQKNQYEKMVFYAEETIKSDPMHYGALLMLATGIAKQTREHDLDREEKLAQSEKYAKAALEALKTAAKPNPQLTDEQWAGAKKDFEAQAHEAFGMAASTRKKFDVAIAEFKMAIEGSANPDPTTFVRLGQIYNQANKPDEAVAILDKVLAIADVHPQIKQFAQAERVRALQAKGAIKPAAPATPPAAAPPAAPPK